MENTMRTALLTLVSLLAIAASATFTGCALDVEPPSTSEAESPPPAQNRTVGRALGVGCASHAQCSIESISAQGYAIAGCMIPGEQYFCVEMDDSTTDCLGPVNLTECNNIMESNGVEFFCNDGIDNDGDGDADGDDPDCENALCDLEESVACNTIGRWTNGDCVAYPNSAGTWCGSDDVCETNSYCDGAGHCIEDDSTTVCCFIDSQCADYACPAGQASFCSPLQLELGSGLCGCFELNTEICYDGIDNDGDGLRDCEDPACAELEHCSSTADCCSPHGTPGCQDTPLVMDVCATVNNDEWCCRYGWDWLCILEYNELTKSSPEDAGVCVSTEVCDDSWDNDFDGFWDCDDSDCAADPACAPEPMPVCGEELSCDDPSCAGDPACPAPTNDVSLQLNLESDFYYQGCAGPAAGIYPSCVWENDAGQIMTWDPTEGEVLLFTFTDGASWPLEVNCTTGAITLTGGFTLSDVFDDPADLASLGCTGVCKDGGRQIRCSGSPE